MPEEMSLDQELRKLLRREPFQSFNIVLTSGDHYEIVDPQSVAIGGSTVMIFLPRVGMSFFPKHQIAAVNAPNLAH